MARKKKTKAEPETKPVEKITLVEGADIDSLTRKQLRQPTHETAGKIYKIREAITKALRDFMT